MQRESGGVLIFSKRKLDGLVRPHNKKQIFIPVRTSSVILFNSFHFIFVFISFT